MNMKRWLFLLLLSPLLCMAQTYKYLGVEHGLSNRRVYCIQKDKTGYMWFLTNEGIDRYNGKNFKHYKLMDGEIEVCSTSTGSTLTPKISCGKSGKKEKSSNTMKPTMSSTWYTNFP